MSDFKKPFEAAIARVLKPLGYGKRGATWHRERDDVISVVNLQKSQSGDDLYLNVGVYLKEAGPERRPPESRCHVRARLPTLTGHKMPSTPGALATEVAQVVVPWLERVGTRAGLQAFLRSDEARRYYVVRRAAELLGASLRAPSA